jgi:hypothetical protein
MAMAPYKMKRNFFSIGDPFFQGCKVDHSASATLMKKLF